MAKKIALLIATHILLIMPSCSNNDSEFHVALGDIPNAIDPVDADVNYALYIIKQLHQPLFVSGGPVFEQSNILDSWDAIDNGLGFKMCLRKGIEFSNGKEVTAHHLVDNILHFAKRKYLRQEPTRIIAEDKCVTVNFGRPYLDFVTDLMSYKTAVVDPQSRDTKIVVGISPYQVSEINESYVHLHSNEGIRFKDVYFHNWHPSNGRPLSEYDDINLISERYIPEDISESLNEYKVSLLKIAALIINEPDKLIREYLYNCTDYKKLRAILYPNKNSFLDVGGIIPIGMPGAISGTVEQRCPAKPSPRHVTVTLYTFFDDCISELQAFFDSTFRDLNIGIKVIPIDANDLDKMFRLESKRYGMTIIGLDVPNPASVYFFDYFMPGESMITDVRNHELEKLLKTYYEEKDEMRRTELMQIANRLLLDNYQALPLCQVDKPVYFSKKVKSITTDQLLLGIPDISKL